jgi:hypothetical protein
MLRAAGALALVALAAAGCNRTDPGTGPGETTVSEAKALDEAAEMIEARKPPAPVVNPTGPLPPSAAPTPNNGSPSG